MESEWYEARRTDFWNGETEMDVTGCIFSMSNAYCFDTVS